MKKLPRLRPFLLQSSSKFYNNHRCMSKVITEHENSANQEKLKKIKANRPMFVPETPTTIDDIEEPNSCCMSGCANCVWIQYAEKLSEVLKNSPGDVQKVIMEKVQDPNMRAFLSMELRTRNLVE